MFDGLFHQARADCGIAHIAGERDAFRAGLGDLFLGGFGRVNGAVDGDVGSGFGKSDGDGCAEAARGTGDEGGLAFQAEFVEYQGNLSFRVGCGWCAPLLQFR